MPKAPSELLDLLRQQRDLNSYTFDVFKNRLGSGTAIIDMLDQMKNLLGPNMEQGAAGQRQAMTSMSDRAANLPQLTGRTPDLTSMMSSAPGGGLTSIMGSGFVAPSGLGGTSPINPASLGDIGLGTGQGGGRLSLTPTYSDMYGRNMTARDSQMMDAAKYLNSPPGKPGSTGSLRQQFLANAQRLLG